MLIDMRNAYSISRRHRLTPVWFLSLCLTLLLLCASCQRGAEGNRKQAHELIVGAGTDVAVSGAFQASLGVYPLNVNVAEPLVKLSPDFKIEPSLAANWEYRGQNTWRFSLRRGVRFHDGQEFNARAVEQSFRRHAKENSGYSFITEDSVKIVDDYTVDITPSKPNIPLPQQLVHPNYSIFAPNTDASVKPIGTGPFRWVDYKRNERIIVERNKDYWGEKAVPERITFRFFPDATTRVLALLSGEIDLVMDFPREQVSTITARPDFTVARAPVGLTLSLQINSHGQAPFNLLSDRTLRKAIGLSLNRQELVQKIWNDEGSDVQNMTVPAILGSYANIVHGFAYDPQQAAQLLDADGWRTGDDGVRVKDGRRLQLALVANTELDTGTVEFVQAQLRRIGMDVQWIRLPDIGTYASRLNAGEFDLNLGMSNQNDGNPLFLPALIYYSKSGRPFARWYYAGQEFDNVVEAGMNAPDPAEVQRLAAEAIHIAVDEEAVNIPVAGVFRLYALKNTVSGFAPHPSQTNQSWTRIDIR